MKDSILIKKGSVYEDGQYVLTATFTESNTTNTFGMGAEEEFFNNPESFLFWEKQSSNFINSFANYLPNGTHTITGQLAAGTVTPDDYFKII